MRRLFYVLLMISMINAMEKAKEPEESPETARISHLTAEELMSKALEAYKQAESLYKEALNTTPEKFENSKYKEAEQYYFIASSMSTVAASKGYIGAASLSRLVLSRIHDIERVKLQLNPNYSVSVGLHKSTTRTERAFTHAEAIEEVRELITWQQALQETNLEKLKEQLRKKEKEATEKALQEASKEKIKEQFKKKKKDTAEKDKKKTSSKEKKAGEKDNKKASSDDKK